MYKNEVQENLVEKGGKIVTLGKMSERFTCAPLISSWVIYLDNSNKRLSCNYAHKVMDKFFLRTVYILCFNSKLNYILFLISASV